MPDTGQTFYHFLRKFLFFFFLGAQILFCAILFLFYPAVFSGLLIFTAFFIIIGLSLAGAHLGAAFLAEKIASPLRRIIATITGILSGAGGMRVAIESSEPLEILETADAVNQLADKSKKDIAEMEKLERARREFLGNVSHELRTPIFSVQGYLETLLDGALDDETVRRQFVEKAYANTVRLNTLLSDLIDISRIESGELRMSFRYFNISELLREVAQTLEIQAEQKNVSLELDEQMEKEILVYGDKERLAQVLLNLVNNAIKYNRPEGKVMISAKPQDGFVLLSVRDTGIGIPEEHKNRIFERFYRVDKGRSRAVGGTGLGLAIVKHILEAHRSRIAVESCPGEGTMISFTLKM